MAPTLLRSVPERLLADRLRALGEWLGLGMLAPSVVEQGEVAKADAGTRMVGAELAPGKSHRARGDVHRLCILSSLVKLGELLIESVEFVSLCPPYLELSRQQTPK
jgi:hypothetical protein